jgi:A/G-specific adenine glycosylase
MMDLSPNFHSSLLWWWHSHQRRYPWRETTNPYHVLVAEVLLHRTRADQVHPLYHKLLGHYPTVRDLAAARGEDVHEILAPAGLRWRVETLLRCAREIMSRHAGDVPEGKVDLEALSGVGHYIASAIRCFAFGYPDAVVDTNTVRIASRVFGFRVNDSSRRNRAVHEQVKRLVSPTAARESNLALLDLGALVCTARKPACESCPVIGFCITGQGFVVDSTLPR